MPLPTFDEVGAWLDSPTGAILASAGEQVINGADPAQVLATTAGAMAGQGQSSAQFLATSGGALLSQYITAVGAGEPLDSALGGIASGALSLGFTAGLSVLGIPPPASTMMAGVASSFLAPMLQDLIEGPTDETYGALGGDFAWRARKYHTLFLPSSFVSWMRANSYSLSGACVNPPSGESPPWSGMSMALAGWLLNGAWTGEGQILLPGFTTSGGYVYQIGIGYSLTSNPGDGWSTPPSGWWWYPYLTAAEVDQAAAGKLAANKRGPLWDFYESLGIDVPATIRAVKATNNASVSNVIYRQAAFTLAADAIENAVITPGGMRSKGQQIAVDAAGLSEPSSPAIGAALGAALLLLR